ncbi:SGNH/GDSL hydrolase family protein [Prosthecobacter sp.]|uniref:SGNH/GDSL hydrolase family protein n=1 Tax=Prosthecobacter sp. TaxID=1965333 RepID=UPI002ABCAB35|nr:SGNH/GDSL hydrolase family protein [Prosthecobacter sp.]MDZ4401710.1 SGNH/GDSL hydrolase family protein [Prosthecobacter sp.]
MKHLLTLALLFSAIHAFAVEPLTDAEKKRLADTELAAKRTPAMREVAKTHSAARKAYTDDRRKFAAERDKNAGKVYREATAVYDTALRKAILGIDSTIEPLLAKQAELKKLGLDKANEGESVADSDSAKNDAMKPPKDEPGLPRVLLIGDSISIGYTLPVRALLKGKANVHRIPQNGGATEVGLEKMKSWLGDGKWDVIHFNFGLHDAKYASETTQRATREQYAANLRTLITQMKATGAKLIFATTTPVPKGGVLSPTRKFDSIEERNKIATQLMQEQGVAIDDLYSVMLPVMAKVGRENDVHFAPEGYEVLAKAVVASIETQLK